jgi:hypothetical protein
LDKNFGTNCYQREKDPFVNLRFTLKAYETHFEKAFGNSVLLFYYKVESFQNHFEKNFQRVKTSFLLKSFLREEQSFRPYRTAQRSFVSKALFSFFCSFRHTISFGFCFCLDRLAKNGKMSVLLSPKKDDYFSKTRRIIIMKIKQKITYYD